MFRLDLGNTTAKPSRSRSHNPCRPRLCRDTSPHSIFSRRAICSIRYFAFDGSGKRLRARQIPCSGWTWAIRQRSLRGADHIIHVARDCVETRVPTPYSLGARFAQLDTLPLTVPVNGCALARFHVPAGLGQYDSEAFAEQTTHSMSPAIV